MKKIRPITSFVPNPLLFAVAAAAILSCSVSHADSGNTKFALPSSSLPGNECDTTSGTCFSTSALSSNPYYFSPNGTTPSPYVGGESSPGNAAGAIDVWGYCRYVDNITTGSAPESGFVPFRSAAEWTAFITNAPPGLFNLVHCARPTTVTVAPDSRCGSAVPASFAVSLPYDKTGAVLPASTSFQCTVPGLCDSATPPLCGASLTWTETVTITFTALDSDVANPSWSESVAYGGMPPPPNPAPDTLCQGAVSALTQNNVPLPVVPSATPFNITQSGAYANVGLFTVPNPSPGGPFAGYFYVINASNLSNVTLDQPNTFVLIKGDNDQNINIGTTNGMVMITGSGDSVNITGGGTPIILNGSNDSLFVTGSHVSVCSNGNNNTITGSGGGMTIDSSGNNNTDTADGGLSTVVSTGNGNHNTASGGSAVITATGNDNTNSEDGGQLIITAIGNNNSSNATGGAAVIDTTGANNTSEATGGVVSINSKPIRQ